MKPTFSDQSHDVEAVRIAWQGTRREYDELVRAWALRELELIHAEMGPEILEGVTGDVEASHEAFPLPPAVAELVKECRNRPLGTCDLCHQRAPLLPPEGEEGLSEGPSCAWGCLL